MAAEAIASLAFPENQKRYIVDVLDPLLEKLVQAILKECPGDPVEWIVEWLRRTHPNSGGARKQPLAKENSDLKKSLHSHETYVKEMHEGHAKPAAKKEKDKGSDAESEEEDDEDEIPFVEMAPKHMGKMRTSVSAEAYGAWNEKKEFTPVKIPKSESQMNRLRLILMKSFMFSALNSKDMETVLLAMKEQVFHPGDKIITEGDEGNFLCIIEEGSPECRKLIDGHQKVLKTCKPGDVFGELALLYNAKRAASVVATDRCVCWELDRDTFNAIVKDAAKKQSTMYEEFLRNVKVFSTLDRNGIAKIADCISVRNYKKGEYVIKQNDVGNEFFILEEGNMDALRNNGIDPPAKVYSYQIGDYFGELALMSDQPRAASVVVTSNSAKVLCLDRKTFKKLLGPLEEILKDRKYT